MWVPSHLLSIQAGVCVFLGVMLCIEVGRRIGVARHLADPERSRDGAAAFEGAIFGLVGLVIAFTFGGALTRWDGRRGLIVQESNAIGTAWLRLDLLPTPAQPELRELFRSYLDARIEVYASLPDVAAAKAALGRARALQNEIWKTASADCQGVADARTCMLLLPALNDMIDITSTQTMALETHPPGVVYALLVGLVLASALMAGLATGTAGQRSWTHMVGFSLAMSVSVFVIVDIEYPRAGLIRIDSADRMMVELRQSMN
ncbi:MAG TPA: DUF4239 domain-containing protein [Myxococcota bacterium]|nr:DUF4239 domain-containing protein [Myxococcota bacterium]